MREGDLVEKIHISGIEAEIRKFFELKMMLLRDFKEGILDDVEKEAIKRNCDVIRIRNCNELDSYFYKSTKIGLYRNLQKPLELANLPRNKRGNIKKAEGNFNFFITENMTDYIFNEWFQIYEERMNEIKRGVKILNRDWFEEKRNKAVGAFSKKDNQIVGGFIILLMDESNTTIPSLAFGSSKKEFFKLGINDFLVWNIINWATEKGFKRIKFGTDTNFYGFHLGLGIYHYKIGWGFYPEARGVMECLKILDFSKFEDKIFFLTGNENLQGNILFRKGSEYKDGKRLFAENLNVINVYEFNGGIKLLETIKRNSI